jgi:hypothetical protein
MSILTISKIDGSTEFVYNTVEGTILDIKTNFNQKNFIAHIENTESPTNHIRNSSILVYFDQEWYEYNKNMKNGVWFVSILID